MSTRHVTAVVLLSGPAAERSPQGVIEAVAGQTRPPDQLIAVATSELSADVLGVLEQHVGDGRLDELQTVSASAGRAGAVREALDLLESRARSQVDETAQNSPVHGADGDGSDGDSSSAEASTAEASTADKSSADESAVGGTDPTGGDAHRHGAQVVSSQERRSSGRSGRRARAVDSAIVERERTQRAEDLARVPQRLREDRHRPGRRIGQVADGESWLWFVVAGATPEPDALERQLTMAAESPNTGAVGAKRVRPVLAPSAHDGVPWEDHAQVGADALVDVGLTLTHGGRIITGVDPGEIDQGQADWRQDVLAVALPGMLVREEVLREVGGLDPDLPEPWAEIDLCRRIWRSGERVAVQSAARVLSPHPTRPRLERLQEQRTGQILLRLKHRPLLMALLMLVALPVATLLRMLGAIAASQPRSAMMELRAWAAAMPRVPRVLSRGRADRRRARVPSGRLAPLYLPLGDSARRRLGDAWTRLFATDDHTRRIRRTTWGIAGTHHGADDADYGRHVMWTVLVGLVSTVLGLVALRGVFGRGELVGPGLRALPRTWQDGWEAAWASWVPGGLGERGPGDPLVRLLGSLPLAGTSFVEAVIVAAVPLSALTAWWAAGAITRAVGARLTIATVWALAPALISALAIGAWPLLLVHALLPLLALAVGRAVGLPHKASQASVSGAAAGGLLLLVLGAVAPVLVPLSALALVLIAIAVPGRRLRLLWVLVPSLALHAPYLPVYLGHPETLLAVGGVPAHEGGATTTDLLSLWPVSPGLQDQLAPLMGSTAALLLPMLPVAPVVLAALVSPLLAGNAGRAGRFSLLMAAVGLVLVLVTRATGLGADGDQLAPPPVHALVSAVQLALSIGAAASFDAFARRDETDGRVRRGVTAVVGALVAAVCVVTVTGWTLLLPGQLRLDRAESGEVPAAAADQGRTDARSRVLVLEQQDDAAVQARLVVHGGDSVIQHAAVVDARSAETARAGETVDGDPADDALREAVARMLSTDAGSSGSDEVEQTTEALAIAYVVVEGDVEEQASLMASLDSSSTLEKVTEGTRGGMWRVIESAPRAVVVGGEEPVALSSGVIDASGHLPASDQERTVILSERDDGQWRATLDGAELTPVTVDGWAQGFEVPAGAEGEIDLHREQPARLVWQILLGAALALTALISIPWRPRSRDAEEMYG